MALEAILRALDARARVRIEEIEAEARKRVTDIRSEAEREAAQTRRQVLKKATDRVRGEVRALVYSASLKARNEFIEAQEEAVSEAFRIAEEHLLSLGKDDSYSGILATLLDECLEYFPGDVVLRIRLEDRELVERMMAKRQAPYRISETPLDLAGGLIAGSPNGEVVVFNTLESRLEKARDKLKLEISNALFEDQAATPGSLE